MESKLTNQVLVVDDSQMIRALLREALNGSFAVTEVGTGEEAMGILSAREIDVVIADKNLPGISGLEVLEKTKELWPDTEVIIITAQSSLESALDAQRLGAFDYLTKPFDEIGFVVGKVQRALEKRRLVQDQARLQAGIETAASGWRKTIDAIDSPIMLLDTGRRIKRMNRAARDLTGKSYQENIGQDIQGFASIQPWEKIVEMVDFLVETGISEPFQVGDESTGKTWNIKATLAPTSDNGEDTIIIVAHDVTREVELQELLHRNAMLAGMGSLIDRLVRELRNPLFSISATMDAYNARHGEPDDFRQCLTVVHRQTERIVRLIRKVQTYASRSAISLSRQRIKDVLAGAVERCRALAAERGIEVAVKTAEDLEPIQVDQDLLLQAFANLLENAIQNSPPGGSVTIETGTQLRNHKPWTTCTIKDSGPGFRAEDIPRLTEPFFARRQGGAGLGLSIAQRIVDEHLGFMQIANRPKGGGVVTVSLPGGWTPGRQIQ